MIGFGMGMIKMILRCFALLMTILVTALVGNTIASNVDAAGTAVAAVNFVMFVAVLSWIVSIVGIAAFFTSTLRPNIQLPLDAMCVLFTFVAGVVISAKLSVVNCGNIKPKSMPGDWIAWGSENDEKKCRSLQAVAVFVWFLFCSYSGSLFFTIKDTRDHFGGSVRSAMRPSMSQISGSVA